MTFTIVDIEPNSPEHFEFRKGKIGASHAPSIMGCGFQKAVDLWEEIVFNKERPKTHAMARGIDLEPIAREYINKETGIDFRPIVAQSNAHPWRIASLDGYAVTEGKIQILEIKCPGKKDHELAKQGIIPKHYMPQLQHQMDVIGIDWMTYGSYDDEEDKAYCFLIEKDEAYCKKLLEAEIEFYNCILDHRRPAGDWVEINNEECLKLASKRIECYNLIKRLEGELEALDKELTKDLPSERNVIGDLKIYWKNGRDLYDYKKLVQDHSIDLEPYKKTSKGYWEMRSS
jgi:putative phage-type endonuclease